MRLPTFKLLVQLTILSTVTSGALAAGQNTRSARNTLRGLKELQVTTGAEGPGVDVERFGLSMAQVKIDTELRLRKVAISVTEDHDNAEGMLAVLLSLLEDQNRPGYYSYVVEVRLLQPISLMRDQSLRSNATTWSTLKFGFVGRLAIPGLREDVADLVDEFTNVYLEQNPKK